MLSVSVVASMMKEGHDGRPTCSKETVLGIVDRLESMSWPTGIFLYLKLNPSIVHHLGVFDNHTHFEIPFFLSSVDKHCGLNTTFTILRDQPHFFIQHDFVRQS